MVFHDKTHYSVGFQKKILTMTVGHHSTTSKSYLSTNKQFLIHKKKAMTDLNWWHNVAFY